MGDRPRARELGLRSTSFYDGERKISERALVSVEALEGRGKTYWALATAPQPIVVFNFDQGLEGVLDEFPNRNIIPAGIPLKPGQKGYPSYAYARPTPSDGNPRQTKDYLQKVRESASPIWEQFIIDYAEALRSKARTLVIDTGTAAYQLGRFAVIGTDKPGKDSDPFGRMGAQLNSLFQGLITEALSWDKSVIWAHRLKEMFDSPGQYTAEGYKSVGYEVPIIIRLVRGAKGDLKAQVMKARVPGGRKWVGEEFVGKEARFSYIMAALHGNEEEEWR